MEEGGGGGFRLSAECLDEPPNSRVFLVLGKDTGEALIRERFAPFGEIQDIWLVRDKRTHESRGIAFVKFARSSQACRAMEEMHGRSLAPDTKPIKVPALCGPPAAQPLLPLSPSPGAGWSWGQVATGAQRGRGFLPFAAWVGGAWPSAAAPAPASRCGLPRTCLIGL